jgi:hypothetical protein
LGGFYSVKGRVSLLLREQSKSDDKYKERTLWRPHLIRSI